MNVTTQVSTNEGGSFLKMGIGEFKVIGINPSNKELSEMLGSKYDPEKDEQQYVYEKEGKDHSRVVFWVQEVLSGWKSKLEFDITDEEAKTKAGNPIWVNVVGEVAKVAKENLQKWFIEFYKSKEDKTVTGEKNFRKSKIGEAALVEFLRAWMTRKSSTGVKMDWWNPECNILPDMKKIFRGNMDELKSLWKADEEENVTGTVVLAAYVDSYEKDGQLKHAQKIWQYKVVPGYQMKSFNVCMQTNSWESTKLTKKYMEEITGEYGIKKNFSLRPLAEFIPGETIESSTDAIRHSTEEIKAPTNTDY